MVPGVADSEISFSGFTEDSKQSQPSAVVPIAVERFGQTQEEQPKALDPVRVSKLKSILRQVSVSSRDKLVPLIGRLQVSDHVCFEFARAIDELDTYLRNDAVLSPGFFIIGCRYLLSRKLTTEEDIQREARELQIGFDKYVEICLASLNSREIDPFPAEWHPRILATCFELFEESFSFELFTSSEEERNRLAGQFGISFHETVLPKWKMALEAVMKLAHIDSFLAQINKEEKNTANDQSPLNTFRTQADFIYLCIAEANFRGESDELPMYHLWNQFIVALTPYAKDFINKVFDEAIEWSLDDLPLPSFLGTFKYLPSAEQNYAELVRRVLAFQLLPYEWINFYREHKDDHLTISQLMELSEIFHSKSQERFLEHCKYLDAAIMDPSKSPRTMNRGLASLAPSSTAVVDLLPTATTVVCRNDVCGHVSLHPKPVEEIARKLYRTIEPALDCQKMKPQKSRLEGISYSSDNEKPFGWAMAKGKRKEMQDACVADTLHLLDAKDCPIFAVFDGHGDANIAEFISRIVPAHLQLWLNGAILQIHERNILDTTLRDRMIENAIKLAMNDLNQILQYAYGTISDVSGTTATICFCYQNRLFTINMGDTRAICIVNGRVHQLSLDARNSDEPQVQGIKAKFGIDNSFVGSVLSALGVFNTVAQGKKFIVKRTPDVHILQLEKEQETPHRIVIASDGVFDVINTPEAADFVSKIADPNEAAIALLKEAWRLGSPDNLTALVADL